MVPSQLYFDPNTPVLGQFFICRNHDKKCKAQSKRLSPCKPSQSHQGPGSWIGPLNVVMPSTVKDDTSGQLHKKKHQKKNQGNFEKNKKFLSSFRKCKFKEIKNLNSCITTYAQKSTVPRPRRYSPPKVLEKTSLWNYNTSKFISASHKFQGGGSYHISLYTSQNLFFGKITIWTFPVIFANS